MSKIGTRYGNDRTELQNVIPLETPYLLFADPSSVCNFRCKFCPCGGANKEYWSKNKRVSIMPYEIFRKLVDDAAEFPQKLKTLRLYKEGEPLLNKRLPDMINYARKKDIASKIDFTTNGSLFNRDLILAVTDAGVDRINISVEALDSEGYMTVSGAKLDFDDFIERLKFLYKNKNSCHIFIKISNLGLGKYSEQDFYDVFSEISDEMAVENVTPVWPGFDLKSELRKNDSLDIYGAALSERKKSEVCPYLFYSMCVNSDGTVSACLMDWNHQIIIGDIKKQSLSEIWNSDTLKQMRIDHLSLNKSKYGPCSECGQLEYAVLDNIDPYRRELLERILK